MKLFLVVSMAFGLMAGMAGCAPDVPDSTGLLFDTKVEIQHLKSESAFIVTYHFSEPVSGVVFRRQRSHFRTLSWSSLTPFVKVGEIQGQEALFSEGPPLSSLQIKVVSRSSQAERDYESVIPFSDGSLALYTGHFDVRPLYCPGFRNCVGTDLIEKGSPLVKTRFTLIPDVGEKVLATDYLSSTPLEWVSDKEGRYIYFGNLPLKETASYRAILDPGLPSWIKSKLKSVFPKIISFYSQRLEFSLQAKPLVLFSYVNSANSYGTKGGVLHQQVRLSVFGQNWKNQNPVNQEELTQLVAHELAHLWNGDLFYPADGDEEPWMHEGGADSFAYRALFGLGEIDREEFLNLQTQALNRCVMGLQGRSLKDSDMTRHFKNYYNCGAIIGLITDAAVDTNGRYNLFKFWTDLFRLAQGRANGYTSKMYYSLLNQRSASDIGNLVSQFVEMPHDRADEFINNALNRVGVVTQRSGSSPQWYLDEIQNELSPRYSEFISIENYNSLSFSH